MTASIGSPQWYRERTAMFEGMCSDIWTRAQKASFSWVFNRGNVKVWNNNIARCQKKHPDYTLDQIKQAFECERDDLLGTFDSSLAEIAANR